MRVRKPHLQKLIKRVNTTSLLSSPRQNNSENEWFSISQYYVYINSLISRMKDLKDIFLVCCSICNASTVPFNSFSLVGLIRECKVSIDTARFQSTMVAR